METYIEVSIVSRYEDHNDFIGALREFATSVDDWEYLGTQSEEYASVTGEPSCAILRLGNAHSPAIAITNKSGNTFYVANIVPKESGRISMHEYNQVAGDFAHDLRKYAKSVGLDLEVKATSESIGLNGIITGTKCRGLFEQYLNLYPASYHPLDIKRLDTFICCLSRHAKNRVDLALLKGWLLQEKGWSDKDASWCVDRIDTGIAILDVNRKY